MENKKIVCLGGGIGTVNLIKGLEHYTKEITIVVSMADDGGSSGRLRRLYNIFPPGDMVSCMAALLPSDKKLVSNLLKYRFPGDRYARDNHLGGHKLGSLILTALTDITGDFHQAIEEFKKIFDIPGNYLPATREPVTISAKTVEGKIIEREEVIDRGLYTGKRILEQVLLSPESVHAGKGVVDAIMQANLIVIGPGDLYTTLLPVLLITEIYEALKKSAAKKLYVVNVANKPFETRNYTLSNFLQAIEKHIHSLPFDAIILNNNFSVPIPKKYKYTYVMKNGVEEFGIPILEEDLVDETFPLYHDSGKLAKIIWNQL